MQANLSSSDIMAQLVVESSLNFFVKIVFAPAFENLFEATPLATCAFSRFFKNFAITLTDFAAK